FAADASLCICRERAEAVAPLEHRQINLGRLYRVEATEGLVMLLKPPDHCNLRLSSRQIYGLKLGMKTCTLPCTFHNPSRVCWSFLLCPPHPLSQTQLLG